jgi:uncharacterized membrane protein YuzA (DUF378 family)
MGPLYIILFISQILILVGALNTGLMTYNIDIIKALLTAKYASMGYKLIGVSAIIIITIRLYNCLDPMLQIK